jgi:hypothetical protein
MGLDGGLGRTAPGRVVRTPGRQSLVKKTGKNTAKLAVYAALSLFLLVPQISKGQDVVVQDASKDTPPAQSTPAAQTPSPTPAPASQQPLPEQPTPQKPDAQGNTSKPQNDRLFGVLPNYVTVEGGGTIKPLSTKEKFKLSAEGIFDPAEFAFVGVVALVNQAENDNPEWHQGLKGYARRYGNAFANQAIGNINTGAIWPSLLHQDPRYFQKAKGSFTHRFFYSASRIVITRTDSGHSQFNYSEMFGSLTTAGISNIYQPRQERTLGNTLDTFGTQVLYDALSFELREFWPDVKHKFVHKSK